MTAALPDLDVFRKEAREWLEANGELRPTVSTPTEEGESGFEWGVGSDNVAVFHNRTTAQEQAMISASQRWQRRKFDAATPC